MKSSNSFAYYLGAFAAMAILGRIDEMLRPKGISMTIAPLGAVCAVLFATPTSPGARVRLVSASSLSRAKRYVIVLLKCHYI